MNRKVKLEYIWLDGYETQNLRSKTKVVNYNDLTYTDGQIDLESVPIWNFDGSSTKQASGGRSECILKPVRTYASDSSFRMYVLCEVLTDDFKPHPSNTRHHLAKLHETARDEEYWWGFEQEYFIMGVNGLPVGFPNNGYPKPQGEFYCGVGHDQVKHRQLVNEHMYNCINVGIDITGVNAEVAIGQWEYQCFAKDTLKACDDLWFSRYLLHMASEHYGVSINFDPKPVKGDWNGSGCHTNFSNRNMRDVGGEHIQRVLYKLDGSHDEHMKDYGENNHQRLTGEHETQHISKFSWGVGDRGASIRVPNQVKRDGMRGYLEDRRPASNCDPYKVAYMIVKSVTST